MAGDKANCFIVSTCECNLLSKEISSFKHMHRYTQTLLLLKET